MTTFSKTHFEYQETFMGTNKKIFKNSCFCYSRPESSDADRCHSSSSASPLSRSVWQEVETFSLTESWGAAAVCRFQLELWRRSGSSGAGSSPSRTGASPTCWCWADSAPAPRPRWRPDRTSAGCSQEESGTEPAGLKTEVYETNWMDELLACHPSLPP